MPLSERARIEAYLPDLPRRAYRDLLDTLEREFTYAFGGCTIIGGVSGSYLARLGFPRRDRVNLIYSDAPLPFDGNLDLLSRYTDRVRTAAFRALDEEAVLVVAFKVFHSEQVI